MADQTSEAPLLNLESMIGFNGAIPGGLRVHPDRQHLVYAVGCRLIIEDLGSQHKQSFLTGHTNDVSCLDISRTGKYVASGQITHMGFKVLAELDVTDEWSIRPHVDAVGSALSRQSVLRPLNNPFPEQLRAATIDADVILWNFEKKKKEATFTLHKVKVQAVAFSPNDKYLLSLGGPDDGSVVVWDLSTKQAICGSPSQILSAGASYAAVFSNNNDNIFITGGDHTLRVWTMERQQRKIKPVDVSMGQLKRIINCIVMGPDDKTFYCGTTTGDVLAINMNFTDNTHNFKCLGPEKNKFSLGVTAVAVLKNNEIIIGTGDGTTAVINGNDQKLRKVTEKTRKIEGAVTSIALRGEGHQLYVGTSTSNVYRFNFSEFKPELLKSCHYAPVNDIAFPTQCDSLLVTGSYQDIRVWDTHKHEELLRITVPNMTCHAVEVQRDGKSIVSGWDDCTIRAFWPESGNLQFVVDHAHQQTVTALALSQHGSRIVSGGKDGQVRLWRIEKHVGRKGPSWTTHLEGSLKEHKAAITCIKVTSSDTECISSSDDSSCIIWDLVKKTRLRMIYDNTLFKYVVYHPQEHQLLTVGTDRKICYYETYDASMIRTLEGSKSGAIHGMTMSPSGNYFATAGDDKLVKLWSYEDGELLYVGDAHSAPVSRLEFSPTESFLISVSLDGAILKWALPLGIQS